MYSVLQRPFVHYSNPVCICVWFTAGKGNASNN